MFIIVSNAVVSINNANAIYIPYSGSLKIETETSAMVIANIPDNALQVVAEGVASKRPYVEFEDAVLELQEVGDDC